MLNPAIDLEPARADFAARGVARVDQFLDEREADTLFNELTARRDWNLLFRHEGRHIDLPPERQAELDTRLREELLARVHAGAKQDYQYFFYNIPIYDQREARAPISPVLVRLCDMLCSSTFIELVRNISGISAIDFADFQVTRYVPGSFLSTHDDDVEGKNRLAAYVLGLTPFWDADWGGLLHLLDQDGEVDTTLVPSFNTLTVFRVPRPHFVSLVAPWAQASRFSVTGWLRAK